MKPKRRRPSAEAEAARIEAVRTSLAGGDERWRLGAAGGNVSEAGYRARSQNSFKTGLGSLSMKWMLAYCDAILNALGEEHSGGQFGAIKMIAKKF